MLIKLTEGFEILKSKLSSISTISEEEIKNLITLPLIKKISRLIERNFYKINKLLSQILIFLCTDELFQHYYNDINLIVEFINCIFYLKENHIVFSNFEKEKIQKFIEISKTKCNFSVEQFSSFTDILNQTTNNQRNQVSSTINKEI